MNSSLVINGLAANAAVFKALLSGVPKETYMWRPAPEKWCLLDIACHLYDEEREDFGARTKQALLDPNGPWVKIDPVAWVTERKYAEQDYEKKVAEFLAEREKSVQWLRSLGNADWSSALNHPKVGPLKAELFLTNWLAHDYLHFRQITRTKYLYLKSQSGDIPLDYAGELWTAA
jgi:hypothetical protein